MGIDPKPKLSDCVWCGHYSPSLVTEAMRNFSNPRAWRVICKCGTRDTFPKHEDEFPAIHAAERWNTGHIHTPLIIDLPANHYVISRVPQSDLSPDHCGAIMTVKIAERRGILEHFMRGLGFVLDRDGRPKPHLFRLNENSLVYHTGVRLNYYHGDTFEFYTNRTEHDVHAFGVNKKDVAWLEKACATQAPIVDFLYEKMRKS